MKLETTIVATEFEVTDDSFSKKLAYPKIFDLCIFTFTRNLSWYISQDFMTKFNSFFVNLHPEVAILNKSNQDLVFLLFRIKIMSLTEPVDT